MPRHSGVWRRGGGPWYSQIQGKKVWIAEKSTSKSQALDELYRLLGQPNGHQQAAPSLSVRDLIGLYLDHAAGEVAEGLKGRANLESKAWFLARFVESLGTRLAASLAARDLIGWLNSQPGWQTSTRALATRHVKAAWRWAELYGHLATNALKVVKAPASRRRERVLSEDEAAQLIREATEPFKSFVAVLLATGARPGELAGLTVDRVAEDCRSFVVPNKTRAKTRKLFRTVYVPEDTAKVLAELVAAAAGNPKAHVFVNSLGRPWVRSAIGKRMQALAAKLKLGPDVCAYGIRHRFGTSAIQAGVALPLIAALMGHAGTEMVMRNYFHPGDGPSYLRDAVEQARSLGNEKSKGEPKDKPKTSRRGPH